MAYFSVVVMLAGLALMIYTAKKQQKLKNPQMLAIAGLAVVVIGAVMLLGNSCSSGTGAIISKQGKLENAKMKVLGDYVAEKFKGKKIAILTDGTYQTNEIMSAAVGEFKDAVGGDIKIYTIKLVPDMPKEGETMRSAGGLDELLTGANIRSGLEAAIADKPDVIVMMYVPMPQPSEFVKVGFNALLGSREDTSKPVVVIASEPMLYDPIRFFIEEGKIAAVVATRTDSTFNIMEDSIPSNEREAFDLRYILIDSENVKDNAKLFQTPEDWDSMLPEELRGYVE